MGPFDNDLTLLISYRLQERLENLLDASQGQQQSTQQISHPRAQGRKVDGVWTKLSVMLKAKHQKAGLKIICDPLYGFLVEGLQVLERWNHRDMQSAAGKGCIGGRLARTENLRAETINQPSSDGDWNAASVACAEPGLKCVGMLRAVKSQLVEQQRGPQHCR